MSIGLSSNHSQKPHSGPKVSWLRGTFWAAGPENSDMSAAHSNEQAEWCTMLAWLAWEGGES